MIICFFIRLCYTLESPYFLIANGRYYEAFEIIRTTEHTNKESDTFKTFELSANICECNVENIIIWNSN